LTINKQSQENLQQMEDYRQELEANLIFRQMRTRLQLLHRTRRQEQRKALQQSDSSRVFALEGEVCGIEQALETFDLTNHLEKPVKENIIPLKY